MFQERNKIPSEMWWILVAVVVEDNSHNIILKPAEWDHLEALKEWKTMELLHVHG